MSLPTFVILGRPNVGKSTLFNRLVGKRAAIVQPEPGVTRDRHYGRGQWEGRAFLVVDTGGIAPPEVDPFSPLIERQTAAAVGESDAVIFLVDGIEGLLPGDEQIAGEVRNSGKPVFLCANKFDAARARANLWDFYRLGLGEPLPISAEHGSGVGEMLEKILAQGGAAPDEAPPAENEVRIAVVGRPNVGKSSLVNRFLGHERSLVSPEPGTTRDPIDSICRRGERIYRFVDTAGIRRRWKIGDRKVEVVSMILAYRSIERAEVVFLVVDATEGPKAMESHIARHIVETGRACVILYNKWDAIDKDFNTFDNIVRVVHESIVHADFAPVLSLSALTGQRCERVFEAADRVLASHRRRISTGTLNQHLKEWTDAHPPPAGRGGKRPRFYYATQPSVSPPHFVLFASRVKQIPTVQYGRYIENRLRETFDFEGAPLRVSFRQREGRKTARGRSRKAPSERAKRSK